MCIRDRGIDIHKKKTGKVFDEDRQEWKDKWGKRAKEDKEKYDWLREVKPGYVAKEDGGDPFLDDRREKKVRMDKEKANMERNQRRAGMMDQASKEVAHLNASVRKLSTASNGKFEVNKIKRSKGKKLSLIHISEPTRLLSISYAVFCLKKKKNR
eukprot:TRINITY_DN2815_c0_g1_i1.p1 TRINITY_DN2815_c0_g1~~TRINITY_DN2815_c0_g1_i1.p1  ORF type:complete len:155 (-),score=77.46 TRINITY_DN2815_c0_g1_i1:16-480(-)